MNSINPEVSEPDTLLRRIDAVILRDDQTIISSFKRWLRAQLPTLDNYLRRRGKKARLAFCPERVVQGKGVQEIGARCRN